MLSDSHNVTGRNRLRVAGRSLPSLRRVALRLLLFLPLLSLSCRLEGEGRVLPPARPYTASFPLRVLSTDPVAERVVRESVLQAGAFRAGWSVCRIGPAVLGVETRIVDPSLDYFRNAALSLASLTTGLVVSVSAKTRYRFTLECPARGEIRREFVLESRGRVGMWAVLPLYTGFLGTHMGTLLNGYRRPDRLKAACLRGERTGSLSPQEACLEYEAFLRSGFRSLRLPLLRELGLIPRAESGA